MPPRLKLIGKALGRGAPWAVLGAAAAFGQAPWDQAWLTLVALTVLFAVPAQGARADAARLWAFGFGYFLNALRWVVDPFLVEPEVYGWMAPFAVLLMAGGLASFWAMAAYGAGRLADARARPFALALALTLAEVARSFLLTGFPWALIGHALIDTPYAALSAWVGPHGLTLILTLAAAVLAWGARGGRVVAPASMIVLAMLGWRYLDPGPAPDAAPDAPVVRLVQPNAIQSQKWDPDKAQIFLARMLRDTAAAPRPKLIVWPETSVDVLLEWATPELQAAADAAANVPLILGINRGAEGRYYNAMALVGPSGIVVSLYDKNHLVPFGEYLPAGDYLARFGLHGLAASEGDGFSAGQARDLITIPGVGRALPLICYEGVFAAEVNAAPERPDFMLLITNDAWFGLTAGPQQHLAQARLRAIEQGVPMVRVANTGISAMIDGKGRITGMIGLGVEDYLDAPLPPALPPTPYRKWGDWPVFLALAGGILGLAVRRRRKRD